jgi:hypothetical protein
MLHDFTPVGTRRIGRDARRPLRDDPVGCARTASRGPGSASPPTPARSWGPPRPSPDHWQPCADRNAKLLHRGERRPSLSPAARPTPAAPHPGRISHIARQAPEDDGGPGVRTSTRIGDTFPIKLLRQRLPANGAAAIRYRCRFQAREQPSCLRSRPRAATHPQA